MAIFMDSVTRILLSITLLIAGYAKLSNPSYTEQVLRNFGFPPKQSRSVGKWLLPINSIGNREWFVSMIANRGIERLVLALIAGLLLLSSCQVPPMSDEQPPGLESVVTPYPSVGSQPTTTPSQKSAGGTMTNGILYFEYEYFQLEGIPPYPSPYLTIDSVDKNWVDTVDPNRFRFERHFITREAKSVEGIERFRIGTGTNGVVEECQLYDGKTECVQQPITSTLTYESWLENSSRLGRRFLENASDPKMIGGYTYKGIQTDEQWGDVHVFERQGELSASDMYQGRPMTETLKFDVELQRQIEWIRTVIDGGTAVVHARVRLITWKIMESSETPADLFVLRPAQ